MPKTIWKPSIRLSKKDIVSKFNKQTEHLKNEIKGIKDEIEQENAHLSKVHSARSDLLNELRKLQDNCSHFLIFEFLLNEFLKVL